MIMMTRTIGISTPRAPRPTPRWPVCNGCWCDRRRSAKIRPMAKLSPIAFLALAVLVSSGAHAAATACKLPELDRPARCGVVSVPEDPNRPHGRQLAIHYAVVPASAGSPHPDPIAVLMGGPGEDAISAAAYYTNEFQRLLNDRDLLLVDSRLTGQSAPAHCHLYSAETAADNLRDFFPPAAVERCRRLLSRSADLTRYIYPYLSNDLERVRVALGYAQLNLFAGSYGTRAAQAFVRQYPKSVRTVYLGSPVPIDSGGPMDFARTEQDALDKTFSRCESDPDCHRAFPNVRKEFADVLARLDSGAVQVPVPDTTQTVRLTRGRFVEWVRSRLYRPKEAVALPWIIHRAYEGDWAPTVQGILDSVRGADESISWGLFFSITCTEDLPFLSEADIAANIKGTALGDYRIRQQQAACQKWPRATLPEGYRNPVHSDIPTLLVTGDQDGGSPLWFTDRVAPGFTNHVTVIVHGQGHTEWNDCVAGLFEKLVRSGTVQGLDGNSCPAVKIPAFKLQPFEATDAPLTRYSAPGISRPTVRTEPLRATPIASAPSAKIPDRRCRLCDGPGRGGDPSMRGHGRSYTTCFGCLSFFLAP